MSSLIQQLNDHKEKTAFREGDKTYTYRQLSEIIQKLSSGLLENHNDLKGKRFGLMAAPGIDYLSGLFGIWKAGGVAVPVWLTYPPDLISYYASDAGFTGVLCSPEYLELIKPIADLLNFKVWDIQKLHQYDQPLKALPRVDDSRNAMVLYTSGTTSKPKGVVLTHSNITAQISTLVAAWAWEQDDQIISFLPLHHIHGIINVVCCALWTGATIHFISSFDAEEVTRVLLIQKISLFMAVPTIYFKFIQYINQLEPDPKSLLVKKLQSLRLMVSGSAALPISVLEEWKELTGHTLLERYGMTEIGMAISNPLNGFRKPGSVGFPLPGVGVRLMDDDGNVPQEGQMGEIQIKGKNVFQSYWQRPEETLKAFTADGWFKSGDVAMVEDGYYRILGRSSADIIKSGGYKISALEIEEVLRGHPDIKDCAVVGLPSEEWGETVAAAIITTNEHKMDVISLKLWIQNKLPSYRVPRSYLQVQELPRNAMGKVIKAEVKKLFAS